MILVHTSVVVDSIKLYPKFSINPIKLPSPRYKGAVLASIPKKSSSSFKIWLISPQTLFFRFSHSSSEEALFAKFGDCKPIENPLRL